MKNGEVAVHIWDFKEMGVKVVHVNQSDDAHHKRDDLPDVECSKEDEEHKGKARESVGWWHYTGNGNQGQGRVLTLIHNGQRQHPRVSLTSQDVCENNQYIPTRTWRTQ